MFIEVGPSTTVRIELTLQERSVVDRGVALDALSRTLGLLLFVVDSSPFVLGLGAWPFLRPGHFVPARVLLDLPRAVVRLPDDLVVFNSLPARCAPVMGQRRVPRLGRPSGLASIVYAVLIVDSGNITGADDVFQVAAMTIVFSIVLHGLSAAPLSRRYGRYLDRVLPKDAPERAEVSELPVRLPPRRGRTAAEEA